MKIQETSIAGLLLIQTSIMEDGRGFFLESFKQSSLLEKIGRRYQIAQSNHSRSKKHTLRGFHREAWDKLVYVVHGTAICVIADTRPESPTFGEYQKFRLGDTPGLRNRIFVPQGLSNAFYCLSEVDYVNDVSREFDPTMRLGIRWDDPDLGVEWPIEQPILSDSDKKLPSLREAFPDHKRFGSSTDLR